MKKTLKRIFLALCFFNFSLTIISTALVLYWNEDNIRRTIDESYGLAAKNTTDAIKLFTKVGDVHSAQVGVDSFYRLLHTGAVFLRDLHGNTLAKYPTYLNAPSEFAACGVAFKINKIYYNAESVGSLEYCYKYPDFHLEIKHLWYPLTFLFFFTCVFGLIFWHICRRVSDISKLIEYIKKINPEAPAVDLSVLQFESQDARQLARSIGFLVDKINVTHNEVLGLSKVKEIADLASQVAHDIRSPLSALRILARVGIDSSRPDTISLLKNTIERIDDIASALTTRGKISIYNRENAASILPILLELKKEKSLEIHDQDKEISIVLSCDENIKVQFNSHDLKRIISNLMNNSIEAIEKSGVISILVNRKDINLAEIVVEDSGVGMNPEVLARLGERGFSYGKSGHIFSGSGLGIHYAKQQIVRAGGEIKFKSEIARGSRITIVLPSIVV